MDVMLLRQKTMRYQMEDHVEGKTVVRCALFFSHSREKWCDSAC